VPDQAPKAARELLAGLLCSPPPHDVAAATRQALRGMREFIDWLHVLGRVLVSASSFC
jgi:hypothetical protein